MNISRFDKRIAQPAHEGTILAMPVLPQGIKSPFGHAWGYLDGPTEMDGHAHPTQEIYFFHRGTGVVVIDDEEQTVSPGDVVDIPPNAYHTVRNESEEELLWFALWWEPLG